MQAKNTIWNRYTKIYDRLWVQRVSLAPTRAAVLKAIKSYLPVTTIDLSLLDMSCGTGQLLYDLRAQWPKAKLLGIEPSDLAEVAISKGFHVERKTIQEAHTICDQFHIVTCTHAFPYYPDQAKALALLSNLLLPQGLLLLAHAESASLYDWFMLKIVKLTTSKALYPSPTLMKAYLSNNDLNLDLVDRIRVNGPGIPTITLYVLRKKS